ncbi:mucin-17-like isoform X1 [Pogonomyrmex barbatus]|uniref:Mucin-17-like isoform X1 n=1 Tax=Pogonomyrmex barbatus TaxID=144034 RepID=A0A6I9WGY6_9HYME|nr:mucin-17-like isoform X1 [Pogonomyrmex barbatus]XP_011642043.1 mucin-17-like isoform X1 [Pogonomyrmex barbatus]
MQQPQSRPLLGDSVSSTTSPNARHNNPVTVLTQQQLQQLQQLQNSSGQSLTFALQQTSNNPQEQGNGSTTGNHIVYVNQLNQLNQSTINPSGTGMGLPPATPTFGVGLNMGLPLSLLNTSLTSLTSNVITTSNPLLNLGLPSINTGLTTINPSLNHLNAINSNLTSNIGSNNINNSLSNLGQDLNSINTGVNTGINRLNTINSTNINSGLSGVSTGLTGVNPNLTNLNSSNVNQNLTTLNTNLTAANSGVSGLSAINPNTNLTATSINSGVNQGLNRSANALATGLTPTSLNSSSAQFPFQTIQSIQTIAPHIVASSNIAHVPNSAISQHPNSNISTISQISNSGTLTSPSIFTSTPSETIHATTANVNHASNVNLTTNIPHLGTMHPNLSNISTSNVQHISVSNEPIMSLSHVSSLSSSQSTGFQPQRQYSQGISPGLSASVALTGTTQPSNVVSTMNTVKTMQNIQGQNISSPGSPFSIPLKSPASNIAPPTPSPSPNRLLLRSPASNSIQSNRNSPSPVSTSTSNSNFNMQMQSPMQSPMSVSQIQSPVLSPYPPAKSPHLLSGNNSLNNRSPAPGGSPGPPVVRPNTPILQQGMQVLQIIHGTPQGYQSTPTQLMTRTQLFGNQQIQIAASKPTKQPPQILPKPPNQQTTTSQQKSQRATTTITNQVTQQSQPQIVLAGPQPNPTTATMIPTAQGLLLNQVLPSTGPVIVQQQPGSVQLILRTPPSAQQQTHTTQLTQQQQLVRVVTAGMQLQGIAPTFFAVPNGFPPAASPVIRHTPSSPAPTNSGTGNSIVIQNAMVQSPQSQISQVTSGNTTGNASCTQPVAEQNLLPPPKKKAKKKKKAKRKDDEPKLDLARIIKISGIGDDDDIFDSELTTESEVPCQMQQSEANSGQPLSQLSSQGTVPVSSAQSLQVPVTNTTNTQASVSQTLNSQLVTQLQMPVQNAIAGQFRLSIGDDGKFILHHTPEPNQPEIDSATAQALIRSLSQNSGQNSQIISQLLSQAQSTPQSTQNTIQRQKYVKSPLSSGNQVSTNTISSTCSQNVICTTSPHHGQICSKPINQQKNINIVPQETNSLPSICVQSNIGSLQSLETQTSKNVNVQNLIQAKNVQSTLSQTGNNTSLNTPDILSTKPTIFGIQSPRMSNASQTSSNQQNISLQKSSQVRLTNACITTNVRQNLGKQSIQQSQQHSVHVQKSLPSSSIVQNDHMSKTNQNLQTNPQETLTLQQESPLFQHNQQITAQTVQTQNVQQIFEQNLQSSNIHQNSMNILQQQSSCNTMQQHDTMNVLHSSIQQNTINVLQQNTAGNVQNIEQNLQSGMKDITHAQQNVMTSLQQQNTSAVLHNASVQQNVNVQQQKVVTANTFSSVNAHHFESQNSANVVQQGINTQQNNQNQNILITTAPTTNTTQQNESQKIESQGANILNSAANNILNNAPKITPEILNALSNLNPNDQLLIANANGQMQVISQQLLQQFLAGQLNATNQTQNQNQTQKIVIGEPDANNQNLQGVQINTPTSQIIVNSSGGAPTIQNNIQNIVVQAAPSQMPQHIQIQNSNFPSQFIDNLNQQQIRNLGNNQPKKTKIVKKTKVAVTAQSIVNSQTKTVTVMRPTMVTANTSNLQKIDNSKTTTTISSTNPTKSEPTHIIANGPLISSSTASHMSVPSNGQMIQRVQTIQLPAQMQQTLKGIQSQIQAILSNSRKSPHDQATLAKLYQEQTKILASGKVVSTTTHSVNNTAETTFSVNVVSTVANIHSQNSFKNQTSATQTQTQTSTASMPITSQTLSPTTSVAMPSSSNNSFINNITVPQSVQAQQPTISNAATQSIHQTHIKQHKFYQNHGTQILNPSSANIQIFSPPITSVAASQVQSNVQQLTQVQTQQQSGVQCQQQSTQCQTDPLDFKPAIQAPSPVKQELSSPIQVQVQSGSPANQVTSPRMISKGTQRIQSPVNNNGSTIKQLVSPNGNSNPLISPRQGVKRRATSPICRQMNRSELVEQQLKIDQNGATNPDMNTPFSSKRDACKRLVRYHCLNEQVLGPKDLTKADEIFEETAKHLLSKFSSMINKYTYLLLMESMREVRTSELMMIDRTIVAEEQSILNRLREQEAKLNEEFKKEEKPLVPKVEPGLVEESKATLTTSPPLVNVSVKRELEDDFPSEEMECKPVIKTTNSTSGDYDEWLEIQKELGVYPSTTDTLKCKNGNNSGNSACAVTRASKIERTRANGECLRTNVANTNVPGVSNTTMKDDCEQDINTFDRRWSSATDLERDLSEDTDLDGLALHSQTQCPSSTALVTTSESGNVGNEHDEINAQVQSAIDSILNLKKRPTNTLSGSSSGSSSSQSDTKDTALDQAVRSILGS